MMFKEQHVPSHMSMKRIVSFLPSATELLYEFGVQDSLHGVTHECKYPPDAASKPQVINSVINSDELTSNEIDTMTCQLLNDGKDIFVLNEKNLIKADPDLIISQETCEVCAAYTNQVNKAVKILQRKPILHSMDPHNLQEIINSVIELGKILGKEIKAKEIIDLLEKRIQNVKKLRNNKRPKVLAIEWIEPFFTAGHWVPEMIQIAGGNNMISKIGEHSRRLDIQEGKSWGKVQDAYHGMVTVYADATIAFPILALYVLSNQKTRKPKRLYKKLDKLYDKLRDDYFKNPENNVKKTKKRN